MRNVEDDFGPVIFAYTDPQAVEDGVLVDISAWRLTFRGAPVNRMTATVWHELEPAVQAEVDAGLYTDAATAIRHTVSTKLRFAGEQGGDIVKVPPRYWLLENEVGGWSLIAPEDY